jgi:ribosomal protein S12
VNFKIIRGKYDCVGVLNRRSSRSRYGVKKWIKKVK